MHTLERKKLFSLVIPGLALLALGACSDEPTEPDPDPPTPTTFTVTIQNLSDDFIFLDSGAQAVPVDANEPGPLQPGDAYELSFYARPGLNLSFATMFVQSNDFFYAPDEQGIALFDAQGAPISGDITDLIMLWDAGTEINQEPGLGPDQAPRQAGPDTGEPDPDDTVRLAPDDFGNLPAVADVVSASLNAQADNLFTLRIENVSTDQTLQLSSGGSVAVPLAPVAYVLHAEPGPLFTAGQPDRGEGLGILAEDGDPTILAEVLSGSTGLATPLAPGVFAVHQAGEVLFVEDQPDPGMGLEALAEDGDPSALADSLEADELVVSSGVFNTPDGASEPGPALPGGSYSFTFEATPGQYLSLATMVVQSNDIFLGTSAAGIALFDADGNPATGLLNGDIFLWDAGTEVNQAPGAGPDQAPRQAAPNTGEDENGQVSVVSGVEWPGAGDIAIVTAE